MRKTLIIVCLGVKGILKLGVNIYGVLFAINPSLSWNGMQPRTFSL